MRRRAHALALLGAFVCAALASAATEYAPVVPRHALKFPSDFGSHPEFRTEWWYITGWLSDAAGEPFGFQITFFRTRPDIGANPSRFSPAQILIAHCALSDPKQGRLLQDQRIRRVGLDLAEARQGDTAVFIERWNLKRAGTGYEAHIDADEFGLALTLASGQAPLLNGDAGFSRKGPDETSASYYYSEPHLKVSGSVTRRGEALKVTGEAWLDHEWSSQYLDAEASGWDWIGINLDDGAALMAFRIRDKAGAARWAGGTLRAADGSVRTFGPDAVAFTPLRSWSSPRTGIAYPVEWKVKVGGRELQLEPLLEDQENDTRLSTGAIYWEGAVRAFERSTAIGRGYLELTGYGERLRLR